MSNNEMIDMNKMTQRELLILLNSKVEAMGKSLEKATEDNSVLKERVSIIETRVKVYSGVIALIVSATTTILISLLKN